MIFGTLVNVLGVDNQPVEKLALVPYYTTREAAEKDGFKLDPFDETKPYKCWVLPRQGEQDEFGYVAFNGVALAKDRKTPLVDGRGKPYGAKFRVPYDDLEKLNIPPKPTPDNPNIFAKPANLGEYQLPLRPLKDDEVWDWTGFGLPCVRKFKAVKPETGKSGDLSTVLDKLEEISAKLDLIGAAVFK